MTRHSGTPSAACALLLVAGALSACGPSAVPPTEVDDDAGTGPSTRYEPFDVVTRGVAVDDEDEGFVVALTSAEGLSACGAIEFYRSPPGANASRVFAKFEHPSGFTPVERCPNATLTLDHPDVCAVDRESLPTNCAVYERWEAGERVARASAISGTVRSSSGLLTTEWSRCTVELELLFEGGVSLTQSFSFHYDNADGLDAGDDRSMPFCLEPGHCELECDSGQICSWESECVYP